MKHSLPTIATLVLLAAAAQAGTVTWDGEANDLLWATPANWSGDAVPGTADTAVINDGTEQQPIVIDSSTAATPKEFRIASVAGTSGALAVQGGSLVIDSNTANHAYVGDYGSGIFLLNGGTFSIPRDVHIGYRTGSSGKVVMTGGNMSISHEIFVGEAGDGVLILSGGTPRCRGQILGKEAAATGIVTLHQGVVLQISGNTSTVVGKNGQGEYRILGGQVSPSDSSVPLVVRETEGASGIVHGWGTWNCGPNKNGFLTNNQLVIADGMDNEGNVSERSLTFTCQSYKNTIENITTNGWYAVNKGKLVMTDQTQTSKAGDSAVYVWGEDAGDADGILDLVNSARVSAESVSVKYGKLTGSLYAPNRSDAHIENLPSGATKVGVWSFALSGGTCTSFDLELRYDHVAAKGLALTLWRYNGTAWEEASNVEWLSGNRVKASGLAPVSGSNLGLFAITGVPHATVVFLR